MRKPWTLPNRLHKRYMKMMIAGKEQRMIITGIGRELLGFIWAIGIYPCGLLILSR